MPEIRLRIDLIASGANADETEILAVDLRDELLQLDVDSVEMPRVGQPPTGAKASAEIAIIGTLLLTTPKSAVLSAVVEVLKGWTGRAGDREAHLEIDGDVLDLKGLSRSQQGALVTEWIARHDQAGS